VISSNSGGLPEVNKHGYSGYLSDVGDVKDMAANALRLLKDHQELLRFKEQAKEQAKEFTLPKVLPLYLNLYERLNQG